MLFIQVVFSLIFLTMSSSPDIKQLLQNSIIWQASKKSCLRSAISTGYAPLNRQLHYGGWPRGAISELLLPHNGIGEIRLLAPLLANLCRKPGYISWINPPYQPYAPALTHLKVQLNKVLLIRALNIQETIWAAQQAMASQACSAVLVWLPEKSLANEIRKLSLAAKKGNCWGIILRSQSLQQHPSAAVLRIAMLVKQRQHRLSIIKQPGGWAGQQVNLDLFPERINWNGLAAEHWPVFSPRRKLQTGLFPQVTPQYPLPQSHCKELSTTIPSVSPVSGIQSYH